MPAYSVLFPLLGSVLGERVVGVLAAVAASAAFGGLAGLRAGLWFVPGALAALASGRITFLLGAALGVAAVWAATRRRVAAAVALGVLTALASPVAALFTGLAAVALGRSAWPLAVAVAVPSICLVVAFGEGGTFPFALSSFLPAFAAGVAVAVAAPRGSALRPGGALYALLCLVAFAVPSPVGGNATRLATLVAVPVCVHLLWPRRRAALAVLALPLAYWVLQPAVRDVARTHGDPSVDAAFFAPVLAALREAGPVRVAVPLTQNKGEALHLARHVSLARGWERQLDRERNPLFYEGELTASRYGRWLRQTAVAYVALPDGVPFDPAGRAEARVVASGPPYLRETMRAGGWRLFAVRDAPSLGVSSIGPGAFTVRRGGIVRVRFTPYWALVRGRGCVEPAPGGWTRVRANGPVTVASRFSLGRVGAESRRCR